MELTTETFIIGTVVMWILYDFFALYMSQKTEYTISYIIAVKGKKYPFLQTLGVLAIGILLGHFFWHQCVL